MSVNLLNSATGGIVDIVMSVIVDRVKIDRPVCPIFNKGKVMVRSACNLALYSVGVFIWAQVKVIFADGTWKFTDLD